MKSVNKRAGLITLTLLAVVLNACTAALPARVETTKATTPGKQGTPTTNPDGSDRYTGPSIPPDSSDPIIPTVPSNPTNPAPPPTSPTPPGTTYTSYIPVVAVNGKTTNFRDSQHFQALTTRSMEGVQLKILEYEATSTNQGTAEKLKFFLPPGTMAFDANFYHFLAYQEGTGAMKLYSPPTTVITSITPSMAYDLPGGKKDYSQILSKLVNKNEVLYYTAGAPANFLSISSPESLSTPLSSGGYVYLNFRHPGGQFQRSLWKIYVKADCYDKWFNSSNTKWDANGNPAEGVAHYCN